MRIVSKNFPCRNIIYFNQHHELHKSCSRMHKTAKSYYETFPVSSPCEWLETFIRLAKGPSFSNAIFEYDNFSITWVLFNSAKCDKLKFSIYKSRKKIIWQFTHSTNTCTLRHKLALYNKFGKNHNQTGINKPDGPPWKIYRPELK